MPVLLLNVVDRLLRLCAPKPRIGVAAGIFVALEPLADKEVFPQLAHVVTHVQNPKIRDQRISEAVVGIVDFAACLQFVP